MIKRNLLKLIMILIIQLFMMLEGSSYSAEIESGNIFNKDITFNVNYFEEDDVMPYCLISPSTVDEYEKLPLIIYLHGSLEVNSSKSTLLDNSNGLPQIFQNWPLEGFNATLKRQVV